VVVAGSRSLSPPGEDRTNRLRAGLEDWLNSTLTPVLKEYEILSDDSMEATAPAKPRVELLSEWRLDAILAPAKPRVELLSEWRLDAILLCMDAC
jgi:hypothetical protein